MNAIVVLWHQYVPKGITSYYRLYMEYFKKWANLWKDEYDMMYLVDSGWDITQKDIDDIGKCVLLRPPEAHQWVHFENIIPMIPAENILILDNDMIVYKKGLIKDAFDKLNNGKKLISTLDGSGGMSQKMWEKFPILENKYLRITMQFTAIKKDLMLYKAFSPQNFTESVYIPELDYLTQSGDSAEAFQMATIKILIQLNPEEIEIIPNDYNGIYLDKIGIAEDVQDQLPGCYHIRNWSLPIHLINDKKLDFENYKRQLPALPQREVCRLFAWLWIIDETCGSQDNALENEIYSILKDFEVSVSDWLEYIKRFKSYHSWIQE